jgi:predicted  nucleic acid-binding Zn-ribbon protein
MDGCVCGSKLFLYLRTPRLEVKRSQLPKNLNGLESEIRKILGGRTNPDQPISISIENLRLGRDGVYIINLQSILRGDPIVLKDGMGVYFIDLKAMLKSRGAGAA